MLLQCHQQDAPGHRIRHGVEAVQPVARAGSDPGDAREALAASDPLAFLRACRKGYDASVRDYRCMFTKQERIDGELRPRQVTEVTFREEPFSVAMRWLENAGGAQRLSYVAGRRVKGGREFAHIHPAGMIALLAPGGVWRDIHGPEMMAESRKAVDSFGFRNTLDMLIEHCEKAAGDSRYALKYIGQGKLDERPCFVIERRLPFEGESGTYPDRVAVIYIDQEWLLPTGVYTYRDDAARELIGSYVITNVTFNVGFTDAEF